MGAACSNTPFLNQGGRLRYTRRTEGRSSSTGSPLGHASGQYECDLAEHTTVKRGGTPTVSSASEYVYLSLGSNLGDRTGNLAAGLRALDARDAVRVVAVSQCYETEPIGVIDQPPFLNMAAAVETALEPLELLDVVKAVEVEAGRAPGVPWGPRILDIDIILWGDRIVETPPLRVPHHEFRHRAFVLTPLAEIAPEIVDPVSGRTVGELAANPALEGWVSNIGALAC